MIILPLDSKNLNGKDYIVLKKAQKEIKCLEKDYKHLEEEHEHLEEDYKHLEEERERLEEENKRLKKDNEHFKKENKKLKEELQSIRKPPKWAKKNKNKNPDGSLKKGKKKGPKKGHKVHRRKRPEEADQETTWTSLVCSKCDSDLPPSHKWHVHYQVDLPPVSQVITTKHILGWSWCSCCNKEVSVSDKLGASLYGPKFHAQVCYWKYELGLSFGKITNLLSDQYGMEISRGVLSEIISRTARKFEGAYEDIKSVLSEQGHLHADETGWRVNGNSHWLWSFSNDDVSFYKIDQTRSQDVVKNVLGEVFRGVLVSDFYAAYNKIDCQKQKCWPHLLRELHGLKEKHPKSKEIAQFSKRAKLFFKRGKRLQNEYESKENIDRKYKLLMCDTEKWVSKKYRSHDLQRLCKRLVKYRDEIYTFIKTGVDPTNNYGEREIRPAVLMRKISYCNRSEQGAHNQEVMMSVARTAKKQNLSFVDIATEYLSKH